MKDREATLALRELAERQHGVAARWQLLEMGLGKRLSQVRTEAGLLIPLYKGVFAVGHRRIDRKGRWMAAVLASGPNAALSHASALALWETRGTRGPVEVVRRAGGPRSKRSDIWLHQTRWLPEEHVTEKDRIPVVTVERALLDMAGRLDARQQEHALVAADRSGALRWPALQEIVRVGRGRKGIGRLRRVAAEVDPRMAEAVSPPEVDFLRLCRDFGLPMPQVNVLVGDFLVDFLWPTAKVVVESDSYAYHGDRAAFERDYKRTVALTAAGYEVHRATAKMLTWEPETFLTNVHRSLKARSPRTASTFLPARSKS